MKWRALLALVTIAGAAARLVAIDFGLPDRLRPDEQYTVEAAAGMGGGRGFNPHFAEYPAGQTYLIWGVAHGTQALRGEAWSMIDPAGLRRWYLAGRLTSAAMGTLSIPLTATLTEAVVRGIGPTVAPLAAPAGVLAAALLAGMFLHARDSHFATTDVPTTFWMTLGWLALAAFLRRGRRRDAVAAGALIGVATATKYPAGMLVLPLVLAHAVRARTDGWPTALRRLALSAAAGAAAFVLATPYLLLDYRLTAASLSRLSSDLLGRGFPGGLRWVWGVALPAAVGWPLVALVTAALAAALVRGTALERLLVAGFAATMAPLLISGLVFVRYVMPLLPLGAVLIAAGVARLAASRRPVGVAAAAVALLALVPSLARVCALDRLLAEDDTRTLARRWMEVHLPRGTTVYSPAFGVEAVAFALPNPTAFRYAAAANGAPPGAWVLVAEHPLHHAHPPTPALRAALGAGATLVLDLNPFRTDPRSARPPLRYDPPDAFFVPLDGFAAVERPGPRLQLYRLAP